MNSHSFLFSIVLLVTLLIVVASKEVQHGGKNNYNLDETEEFRGNIDHHHHGWPSHYFHGKKRPPYVRVPHFPWGKPRAFVTCDKYPRVCRAKWSPGPNCCKKRCVNVKTDVFNCGKCGLQCEFPEMCCSGKCVNLWEDSNHCGNCYNKCIGGSTCIIGMCNYA